MFAPSISLSQLTQTPPAAGSALAMFSSNAVKGDMG
jgi:hypothetical protein